MAQSRQPNVVFVFSDQQRWDTLGVYGSPVDMTPNLDAMAREGTRFNHAFTCQPVCGPARSCLQTGKYAEEVGCWRNDIALPLDERTIAHDLSESGYEVGYIGKWHLASTGADENFRTKPVPPERRGGYKDYWLASDILEFTSHAYDGHMFDADVNRVEFPEGRYRVDCLTDFAIDYFKTHTCEQPFFLFLSYIEPHHQNDMNCFQGPTGSKERFKDAPIPADLNGMRGDWPEQYADYLGCCASLDENVGRIRDELERLGLSENTVIIYTSDHGCHFCTRNSEYKRSCHEGCIRIPMLACGPGFKGGRVVEELVSLIDIPPTILTAANADAPGARTHLDAMRGRPLQDLLEGREADWPEEVFLQISESHTGRAIRTDRWKYAAKAAEERPRRSAPRADVYEEAFLYDLEADPHEKNNLVKDPAYTDIRAELAVTLKRRMREAGEEEPTIVPAKTEGLPAPPNQT